MIAKGIKKEEYREIKPHWDVRLLKKEGGFKDFDFVCFRNGYGKDAPEVWTGCDGIVFKKPIPEWCAGEPFDADKLYYAIKLGKVLAFPVNLC